jgi:hypothetical protein
LVHESEEQAVKIIAYSKVPSHTPFVHLAYLSTTVTKPATSLLIGGLLLVVTGVCVLGQTRLPWARCRTHLAGIIQIGKWPPGLLGATALLLGGIAIALAYDGGTKVYSHPDSVTKSHMWIFRGQIRYSNDPSRGDRIVLKLPAEEGQYDVASVFPHAVAKFCIDAWDQPLKLRVHKEGDQVHYAIISSGPDRRFNTADDIVEIVPPAQESQKAVRKSDASQPVS